MGIYLNPGNSGFTRMRNDVYVDKSGLIRLINETIDTPRNLTCVSRPRRFGKSFATQMLCAYYDKTCDSSALFDDLEIVVDDASNATYREHLNQYDVIYLDMTNLMGESGERNLISFITDTLTGELSHQYPGLTVGTGFSATLVNAVSLMGNKFIMIVDEWDAPIRENPSIQREYLEFLRTLFKSSATTAKIFAAVYMTGILPIKKDGSQSAISDFEEYTMIDPQAFAQYAGFTESDVLALCRKFQVDFEQVRRWYDGYRFEGSGSVYNPNSVMKAVRSKRFKSYWTQTSAADSLMKYISRDEKGLAKTVAELLAGIEVEVDPNGFSNDLVTFRNRDDVLTLLIHLGYLAYDDLKGTARIPNEEIRIEFAKAVRQVDNDETMRRVRESDQLILDTIHGNAEAVAAQIEKIHREETAPLFYNREESLRSVIKLAYFSYKDHYLKFEELPSGDGYADIVYLPKKKSDYPALVIELKWNTSAEGAIAQIKDRHYPEALQDYGSDILLVGISYDRGTGAEKGVRRASGGGRKHTCIIEAVQE